MNTIIVTGSTRRGRHSPKAALLVYKSILHNADPAEIVDLLEYDLPLLEERLKYLIEPPDAVVRFAEKVRSADAVVVISPEYNGGYSAVVKNAIDYLKEDWSGKPIGIVVVSAGPHGGKSCMDQLKQVFARLGSTVTEGSFIINNIGESITEEGEAVESVYGDHAFKLLTDLKTVVSKESEPQIR
jgi:NAD(P)H-dependent FMN reductase